MDAVVDDAVDVRVAAGLVGGVQEGTLDGGGGDEAEATTEEDGVRDGTQGLT